jgi:hypothetical protein
MRALLLALVLAGCGSSSSTQPTTTPETVTAAAADPGQLVDALLGDSPAAGWSPTEKRAIYPVTYQEEGSGAGLSIAFAGIGAAEDDVEVYTPGQDEAAAVAEAKPKLVERITGKGYVMMEYTAWPDEAPSLKLPTGEELAWTGTALSANGKELTSIPPEDPHQPRPSGVFSLAGSGVIVFTFVMDPGEAYTEGFNAFTGAQLLAL